MRRSLTNSEIEFLTLFLATEEVSVASLLQVVVGIARDELSMKLKLLVSTAVFALIDREWISLFEDSDSECAIAKEPAVGVLGFEATWNEWASAPVLRITDGGRKIFFTVGHPEVLPARQGELREFLFGWPHGMSEEMLRYWAARVPQKETAPIGLGRELWTRLITRFRRARS